MEEKMLSKRLVMLFSLLVVLSLIAAQCAPPPATEAPPPAPETEEAPAPETEEAPAPEAVHGRSTSTRSGARVHL
jgi:hypothetical protein